MFVSGSAPLTKFICAVRFQSHSTLALAVTKGLGMPRLWDQKKVSKNLETLCDKLIAYAKQMGMGAVVGCRSSPWTNWGDLRKDRGRVTEHKGRIAKPLQTGQNRVVVHTVVHNNSV